MKLNWFRTRENAVSSEQRPSMPSQTEIQQALPILWKQVAEARASSKKDDEALVLYSIGSFYDELADYGKALECLKSSLDLYENLEDVRGQMRNLQMIGIVLKNLHELDKALEHYLAALQLAEQLHDIEFQAITLAEIGSAQRQSGDLRGAYHNLSKALAIFEEVGDTEYATKAKRGLLEIRMRANL